MRSAIDITPYYDDPKRIEEPQSKEEQKSPVNWSIKKNTEYDKTEIPGIFANKKKSPTAKVEKTVSNDLLLFDFGEEKVETTEKQENKTTNPPVTNLLDAFDF